MKRKMTRVKQKVIVCKDEKDWIDLEIGQVDELKNMCNIYQITSRNISEFENCVIVPDDMRDRSSRKNMLFLNTCEIL